jgi:RNA polymerase sigma-70 factor, ECF subfamily
MAAVSTDEDRSRRADHYLPLSTAAPALCRSCAVAGAARGVQGSVNHHSWLDGTARGLNGCARSGHHGVVTAIPMPLVMPAVPDVPVVPDAMPVRDDDAGGDGELVERLRAGDRAAIEQVYLAHHAAIRGFARRLVGDAASAEDIVHEAFVALPRAIRRFRGEGSLRAFLIGVAANHSRRHVRSAMRRRRATERLAAREEVRPRAVDATDELITRQMANRLWAALDELPIDQRVAFVLCEAEQRTSVEVAAIVGAPEGTVRTRLFHAKRKLRQMLEAGEGAP